MTDPDVPSRRNPTRREFVHWMRVNIPGSELRGGTDEGEEEGRVLVAGGAEDALGEEVYQYVGAGPPPNTGLHRYVFLVYRQQGGRLHFGAKDKIGMTGAGRAGFNTRNFSQQHGLGEPVGWCMFEAEYDSYCDELYAKLRGDR